MKTKRNHRSSLIVVLSLVLLMAMLTACSSATVEETKVSETVEVKEEVEVVEVEVAEAEPTAEPTPEPTAEPTPEPTPEAVVYEGIDMQSELPGAEWVQTFVGIIEEAKIIVYNDETNKKMILEEAEVVQLEEGDVVALFDPEGKPEAREYDGIIVSGANKVGKYYVDFTFLEGFFTERSTFKVTVASGEGKKVVTCTLIPY